MRIQSSVLAIVCALAVLPAAVRAETVRFTFAPTIREFTVTAKTTNRKEIAGVGTRTDESTTRVKVKIERTKTGFTVTSTPVSMTMKRDGQEVKNPLAEVLRDLVTTLELDTTGRAVSAKGYETLDARMKQVLPPEAYRALSASLTTKALETKDVYEWNGRIGDFAGNEYEVGKGYASQSEYSLPNAAPATYYSAFKIAPSTTVGGKKQVRVLFRVNTTPDAFAGFADGIAATLAKIAGADADKVVGRPKGGFSISGEGERIVDPATMLIDSESNSRVIKMTMTVPSKGDLEVVMTETKEYRYDYPS